MTSYGFNLTRNQIQRHAPIRRGIRRFVGAYIAKYVRERVQKRGRGARGKLRGYSEASITMSKTPTAGVKKYRPPPVGGIDLGTKVLYKRGYKEYREALGKRVNAFVFDLTGDAWRDWDYSQGGVTADIEIGFSKVENEMAAKEAENNGRAGMFEFDRRGFAKLNRGILNYLQAEYKGFEQGGRARAMANAKSAKTAQAVLDILNRLLSSSGR